MISLLIRMSYNIEKKQYCVSQLIINDFSNSSHLSEELFQIKFKSKNWKINFYHYKETANNCSHFSYNID